MVAVKYGVGLFVAIGLTACGSSQSPDPMPAPQDKPAFDYTQDQLRSFPDLQVGDSFRFDSPDVVWRVTGVQDDKVIMVSETGARQVRPRNPLLPNIEWSNKTHGQGKRLITNIEGSLFPLEVGNRVSFTSTVDTNKPPYAWEYDWSCQVTEQKKITVPAGEFDTFKVDCKRREQEVISIYYSPKVGYAVRFDNSNPQSGAVNSNMLIGYQRGETVAGQIVPGKVMAQDKAVKKDETGKMTVEQEKGMPKPMAKPAVEPEQKPKQMKKPMEVTEGAVMLHLASYKQVANLEPSWRRLQNKFRAELEGLGHIGKRVDIPGKGVFTRLLAGPVSDGNKAAQLCRALKAKGQYCAVKKR